MTEPSTQGMSRRSLFALIGSVAGSAIMYQAMSSLAYAEESKFGGPPDLSGDVKGATVLILGAGLAGMSAAYEMRKAGYQVQILEYQDRAGGRNWSIRGGDTYTELGGATQHCEFDKGGYLNPGPWRIPNNHYGVLHYCRELNVALQPFMQVNYNAYVHSTKAYGGKPQRYRHVQADFQGYTAELLAKSTRQAALDQTVTKEDREILLQAMRQWGALDSDYKYAKGLQSSGRRGYDIQPGGGLMPLATPSEPLAMSELLQSGLWSAIGQGQNLDHQSTIFQPVGGMGMIGTAFGQALGPIIKYGCKVTEIVQDDTGVTVTYVPTKGGPAQTARAQWLINTIPASILSQIPMNVGEKMQAAINALSYEASFKVGLQFKRRFWEEDDKIYGGISYTNLPINTISYPSADYFSRGKGVLLGGYAFGPAAYRYSAMSPAERIARAVEEGSQIHPQYKAEFENGVSVAWHRVPWVLGCAGHWSEDLRAEHYADLCAIDGRIVLAGEHASYIPAWQEGAILSAADAVGRLHKRVLAA
jgi:monoamine oxidase